MGAKVTRLPDGTVKVVAGDDDAWVPHPVVQLGCCTAFAIVVVCAAVAVGWQILRWGRLVG